MQTRRLAQLVRQTLRPTSENDVSTQRFRDLVEWSQFFLPHYFTLPVSKAHRWFAKTVEENAERRGFKLNFLAPRGAAKSTLGALAYPLREALEGRESYIWLVSDVRSQAQNHLNNIIKELEENPRIRQYYLEPRKLRWSARSNRVAFSSGVAIECYGTGQKLRGRRERERRPTLIIGDDLQNDDHIVSKTRRERSRRWFFGALLKAGNVKTNVVNLATALHPEAIGWELLSNPAWVGKSFPAILRFPDAVELWNEWKAIYLSPDVDANRRADEFYRDRFDEMNAGAEVLWPENESLLDLMKMRIESGEKVFLREKQNSPLATEYNEFPDEYFEDVWADAFPQDIVATTLALDPSKGRDASAGDYSAFVVAALAPDGTIFIDATLGRFPTSELVDEAFEIWRRYRPDVFAVETNQFQELLRDELERSFRERGVPDAALFPIENRLNKNVRIRRLGAPLSKRKLRFLRDNPSNKLLIEQLQAFPCGAHDDGPDALEMALRVLTSLTETPVEETFSRGDFGANRTGFY